MILCVVCFDLLGVCVLERLDNVLDGIARNTRSMSVRKLHTFDSVNISNLFKNTKKKERKRLWESHEREC